MFRFFKDRSHAESLITGSIWFGSLRKFRRIEDAVRRDETEGTGRVLQWRDDRVAFAVDTGRAAQNPGYVERIAELQNAVFCLCFTKSPEVGTTFGPYGIEVTDPARLLADIHKALDPACSWQRNAAMAQWDVDYDKGEVAAREWNDPVRLAIAQKPKRFEGERETRIVLISHSPFQRDANGDAITPDDLVVTVGEPLDYLRRLY